MHMGYDGTYLQGDPVVLRVLDMRFDETLAVELLGEAVPHESLRDFGQLQAPALADDLAEDVVLMRALTVARQKIISVSTLYLNSIDTQYGRLTRKRRKRRRASGRTRNPKSDARWCP